MSSLNFIDLFAGASGMSEGFIKAGFNSISHVEMDIDACNTIKTRTAYHFLSKKEKEESYYSYLKGETTRDELYQVIPKSLLDSIQHREISDETIDLIFDKIEEHLDRKNIDLIIGGPPCQAYSLIRRHQKNIENDPRNELYIQYGRFLKKFKPKAFVFENVQGILSADKGKHFQNLEAYFDELGYKIHVKLLNASDYGVVQARKRVIIVGWQKGIKFGFPDIPKLQKDYVVNDALCDLPRMKPGDVLAVTNYTAPKNAYLEQYELRNGVDFVTQHISRPHNKRDLKIYRLAIKKWDKERVRIKYPDLPANLRTHKNLNSFTDRFKVVDGKGIAHTVVAHIAKDGHYYIHPDIKQCRSISVREAARLQSFPDDFFFEGSRTAVFKQIGNAVPPLMSYAIAKEMKQLLCQVK